MIDMVEKLYCDACKGEIEDPDTKFDATIWSRKSDENVFDADLCEKCKEGLMMLMRAFMSGEALTVKARK